MSAWDYTVDKWGNTHHDSSFSVPRKRRNADPEVQVILETNRGRERRNAEPTIKTRSMTKVESSKKEDIISPASPTSPETTTPGSQMSMTDRWKDDAKAMEQEQCHPVGWTKKNHYSELGWMWCGQSCPCCRTQCGDKLGGCPICAKRP